MSSSLRPLSRSRCGLLLAWAAWLMVLISPLQAAPAAMSMAVAHSDHGVSVVGHEGMAMDGMMDVLVEGCCSSKFSAADGTASHACHCASLCATALPAWTVNAFGRVGLQTLTPVSLQAYLPSGVRALLLRPPAV